MYKSPVCHYIGYSPRPDLSLVEEVLGVINLILSEDYPMPKAKTMAIWLQKTLLHRTVANLLLVHGSPASMHSIVCLRVDSYKDFIQHQLTCFTEMGMWGNVGSRFLVLDICNITVW